LNTYPKGNTKCSTFLVDTFNISFHNNSSRLKNAPPGKF